MPYKQAPVDPNLTESVAKRQILLYLQQVLRELPDGWSFGSETPDHDLDHTFDGGSSSRITDPAEDPERKGPWSFQIAYCLRGYSNDLKPTESDISSTYDRVVQVWRTWGWVKSEDKNLQSKMHELHGQAPGGYNFSFHSGPGGITTIWTSPPYLAVNADATHSLPRMPWIIWKDRTSDQPETPQ